MTYWFDEKRKIAFCLIEAPNKQAIIDMQKCAHGDIPNSIIEVNEKLVESFLGRINNPTDKINGHLNIINESTYRFIIVTCLMNTFSQPVSSNISKNGSGRFLLTINSLKENFDGSIVFLSATKCIISFTSVLNCISYVLKLDSELNTVSNYSEKKNLNFSIAINAGVPLNSKNNIFEDTIKLANRLNQIEKRAIKIASEVNFLTEFDFNEDLINDKIIFMRPGDKYFLTVLMDFMEEFWSCSFVKVEDICRNIGISKSQLYRKMVSLIGKTPNIFLKEYRLKRALALLNKKNTWISQIAYDSGFNSLAYFLKFFLAKYGVLPPVYSKQIKSV